MKYKLLIVAMLALSSVLIAEVPDAPTPSTTVVSTTTSSAVHQRRFFDKTNIVLFSTEFLVRGLDAQSTRMNLTNPCRCYKEDNTVWFSATTPRQYAYSFGVAAGVTGLSYLFYRTGHHRLEKLAPLVDILFDGSAVVHNYAISGAHAVVPVTH
jgi:hypothetical protein